MWDLDSGIDVFSTIISSNCVLDRKFRRDRVGIATATANFRGLDSTLDEVATSVSEGLDQTVGINEFCADVVLAPGTGLPTSYMSNSPS